ncbi:hypothetical protein GEV33_004657 [Tenebrio molitor]|uniref:Uncharacterized protein n=1 Tax=Tenebrio molitor TaxID=7067 RepID=A0A8J6HNZ9_TENMO|nr:hypothetical protein GEV33_004657 [Tenebrio molitor]
MGSHGHRPRRIIRARLTAGGKQCLWVKCCIRGKIESGGRDWQQFNPDRHSTQGPETLGRNTLQHADPDLISIRADTPHAKSCGPQASGAGHRLVQRRGSNPQEKLRKSLFGLLHSK